LIKLRSADRVFKVEFGFGKAIFAAIIFQTGLYFFDLYDLKELANRLNLTRKLVSAMLMASLLLGIIYWIFPAMMLIPGIWPGIWIWNGLVALIAIYTLRVWIDKINSIPAFGSSVLIAGCGELAAMIARELQQRPSLGIHMRGFLSEDNGDIGSMLVNRRVLGSWEDLISVVERHNITHIVVAMSERRGRLPLEQLLNLKMEGIVVEDGTALYEQITGKLPVKILNPSYLVFSTGFRVSKLTTIYKRAFSIIFSLLGLIFCAPIMLLTAIAIKLDSRGSIFFQQDRVGKGGRIFQVIKFRSMYVDAEAQTGPIWAQADDPRITRVGRFIRRARIDELPQFINVLKGDMNFVGPRPERPYFVDQLQEVIPYYGQRHLTEPGLTGWAQVKFPYGSTIKEARKKLEYDLYYIKNMSMLLDLLIIFHTVKIVLLGRGAR
jgi:sugar transferase (PEP-CTERM system associated)